jgi:hypothetical protein
LIYIAYIYCLDRSTHMMENAYIYCLDLTSVWWWRKRRRSACAVEQRQWRRRRPACTHGRAAMAAVEEVGLSGIDGGRVDRWSRESVAGT